MPPKVRVKLPNEVTSVGTLRGPRCVIPTMAAVDVLAPSIGLELEGTSST